MPPPSFEVVSASLNYSSQKSPGLVRGTRSPTIGSSPGPPERKGRGSNGSSEI